MESKNLKNISIDIPNYNGPLEVLLDLAKTQKVDLSEISITKLADQFLNFIKESKRFKFRNRLRIFIDGYLVGLSKIKIIAYQKMIPMILKL